MITKSLERKKKTKWKSKFEIKKYLESKYGKNWNLVTIYLITVIVITEIIMLMNKDNNK